MSDPMWWEKTVEYRFLQVLFLEKANNICPLDGNEELVGDAITFINSKWSLIEFKKSYNDLGSEKKKYASDKNYEKAKHKLAKISGHHHFVYGDIKDHNFTLCQQNYWGNGNSSSESVNIVSKVLDSGIEFDKFIVYILRLLSFKKQNSASSSTIFSFSGNSYVFLSSNKSDLFNLFFYYLKSKFHKNGYKFSKLDLKFLHHFEQFCIQTPNDPKIQKNYNVIKKLKEKKLIHKLTNKFSLNVKSDRRKKDINNKKSII